MIERFMKEFHRTNVCESVAKGVLRRSFTDQIGDVLKKICMKYTGKHEVCITAIVKCERSKRDASGLVT